MAHERLVTARGIIFKDDKIFAQKLRRKEGTNSFWSTPGGKVDPYESVETAVARELMEETGVVAEIGRLLFVQQFKADDLDITEFFFHVKNPDDFENIDLASTSHGALEVAEFDFVDPKTKRVLPPFLGDIALRQYVETDMPVLFYSEL